MCFKPYTFLLSFLLLLTCSAKAQTLPNNLNSYTPPSPNASSTVNVLGSYNIDKYSGKLSYSAPVKKLTIGKVSIPVGVNYTSSGIRVQDVAGPVGLGWNMSAGGAITRFVVGLPDESTNGYCGPNSIGQKNYFAQNLNYYQNILNGTYDSRPDKFYFSFLGFSGVFMLDDNGNAFLQSSYGLKIIYNPFNRTNGRMAGGNEDWIIADQAGNKYYLGDSAIEYNVTTTHGQSGSTVSSYISTWYINKLVTVDGQVVNFNYLSGNSIQYYNYVNTLHTSISGNTVNTTLYNENSQTFVNTPLYLKSITNTLFEIDFKYDLNRTDLPGALALTEIDAMDNNYLQYIYRFHYSYFNSSSGSDTRLRLDGISQESTKAYDVHYIYSFNYNLSQNLPDHTSLQTDYLGYFNSNPGTSNIDGYQNCSKVPDPDRSAANILTSVVNNTGGVTAFTYEQNTVAGNQQNLPKAGLRIKKTALLLNNAETYSETYNYNDPSTGLSSGQEQAVSNSLSSGFDTYQSSELMSITNDIYGPQTAYTYVTVQKTDGSSIRYKFTDLLTYPDNNTITYFCSNANSDAPSTGPSGSVAVVAVGDRAQTSYSFMRGKLLSEEYIDNTGNVVKKNTYQYSLSPQSGNIIGVTVLPAYFTYNISWIGYFRNTYSFFTQDIQLTSKTSTTNIYNGLSLTNSLTETENYTYKSLYPNLISTTTRSLSDGSTEKTTFRYPFDVTAGSGSYVTSSYPMSYLLANGIIAQPVEVIKSNIAGGVENILSVDLTSYQANTSGLVKPYLKYRWNSAVPVTAASYQNYQVANPNNGGSEIQTVDAHMEPAERYTFDVFGNLQAVVNTVTTTNDGFHSYLYGYGGGYLKSEIINSGNGNYYFEGFEEPGTGSNIARGAAHTGDYYYNSGGYTVNWTPPDNQSYLISYWYRSGGSWKYSGELAYTGSGSSPVTISSGDACDDIRIWPSTAMMSTSTYQPLVGMTSLTDPKGQASTYAYDNYQRLSTIRDRYGNIVKSFSYQNFNPTPVFFNNSYQGTFVPAGCGPGMVGIPLTVTVPANTVTSPYSQADAEQQSTVYAQNFANTNGGCVIKPLVFARIEYSNYSSTSSYTDPNNYSDRDYADVYIKFYTDATCSTPLVLSAAMSFVVNVTSNSYYGYGGGSGGSVNGTYNVNALASSYFIGNITTDYSATYTDPYSGYGNVTDTFSSNYVMVGTADYTALPTQY